LIWNVVAMFALITHYLAITFELSMLIGNN